jgi:hypothetical protein
MVLGDGWAVTNYRLEHWLLTALVRGVLFPFGTPK